MSSHQAEPCKKPNTRNTKHGLTLLKRGLKAAGTQAIDRRTSLGKALDQWRDELVADLGGASQITTQQCAIVMLAVRTKLLLDSIDHWLLQQPSLVNARKRALLPAVLQRQQLADAFARYMTQLGLDRRVHQVPSLSDYLATASGRGPQYPAADPAQLHTRSGVAKPPRRTLETEPENPEVP